MPGIRIIGGSARGRRLRLVPGTTTRPITDRVKEALFDILGEDVVEAAVLDLFAGTGQVVQESGQAPVGTRIETRLTRGRLVSRVEEQHDQ